MNPSEAAFEIVTANRLREWIKSGSLSEGHMSLALEIYGKKKAPGTTALLLPFLVELSALIREGAVIGIAAYWDGKKTPYDQQVHVDVVRACLVDVMVHDSSEGVRRAAQIALQESVLEA